MLFLKNLEAGYGNIIALKKININVEEGSIVSLIGANGAGKSSTMKVIMGLIKAKSGEINFKGKDITNKSPHNIVSLGISCVPEGRRILETLTVYENLEMGAFQRKSSEIKEDIEKVFVKFPILSERSYKFAGTLSGGQQQMLAIGRALMAKPKILLLDEPSMGLAPIVIEEIFNIIKEINKEGVTILLVEQNAKKALSISDYTYVMETGNISFEGQSKNLINDDRIKEAYLGIKK